MIAARLGDRKTAETLVLVKADILMEDNVSEHIRSHVQRFSISTVVSFYKGTTLAKLCARE